MPSTYTDILGLELQETGENLNSWGDRLNAALRLIDDAQDFAVIPLSGNLVLSNTMNQPNQARKGALAFTDNGLTAAPTVTLPDYKRLRYVENRGATYAITFTAGGVAGVLPPGRKALVLCNGTDVSVVDWVAATDDARIAAQAARDLAQSWASLLGTQVAGIDYSSREYAVGGVVPVGSAKSWASKTGSAVASSEFSAREHASGAAVTTGSAKAWAITTGVPIAGGEYAAKEYALGDLTATGGSAKAWATDSVSPDGSANKSAKSYASDAAGSATAAANSATSAGNSAIAAADAYDAFDDRYLGAKVSDPTVDNDGAPLLVGALYFNTSANEMRVRNASNVWQVQVPDASNYYTKPQVDALFGNISPILPITMTAPASGATDVGAGGTYTFVARAFVGDTTGFYSNYGVPVASRFVNVYEPGGTVPVKTFTAAGGGATLVANFASPLVVSHAYQFEFGYTDAQGNTVKSPKVSATTASQFKPTEGQAYQGGFLGFQNFGDGDLFDLVVATKSTEASRLWNAGGGSLRSVFSRLNGPQNTTNGTSTGTASNSAQLYVMSVSIGDVPGYLGAIDEQRAISSKLKPSVAVEASFKTGGAQVFDNTSIWSSTESDASNALSFNMTSTGGDGQAINKSTSYSVRAIKRVATFAPYPIGTAMEGGTLAAYFTDLSSGSPVTYMLIVADKAAEVTRAFSTGSGGAGVGRTNGLTLTNNMGTSTAQPAANYCYNLISGGKDDWYLGAIDEMLAIARMNSQLPSGQQLNSGPYWASTEVDASNARAVTNPSNGYVEQVRTKDLLLFVRPIRRVLIPST